MKRIRRPAIAQLTQKWDAASELLSENPQMRLRQALPTLRRKWASEFGDSLPGQWTRAQSQEQEKVVKPSNIPVALELSEEQLAQYLRNQNLHQ